MFGPFLRTTEVCLQLAPVCHTKPHGKCINLAKSAIRESVALIIAREDVQPHLRFSYATDTAGEHKK